MMMTKVFHTHLEKLEKMGLNLPQSFLYMSVYAGYEALEKLPKGAVKYYLLGSFMTWSRNVDSK